MDRKQAEALLEKYTQGLCTPAEKALVERWYHDSLDAAAYPELSKDPGEQQEGGLRQIQRGNRPHYLRWLPYAAAAVAVLLSVGWLLLVDGRKSSVDSLAATDILPGGNRATLTLADGRVIDLDEAQTGIIVGTDDITYDDGSAVSPADSPHAGLTTDDLRLTTPKGGTYQITLPDGSKVWLNSASTLKYPSRFSGDTREVVLEGEAYFEIQPQVGRVEPVPTRREAQHLAPFNVQTAGQVVQVLGTQFNISAYADDPETKTTLVEGKVKVTPGTQTGLTTNDLRLPTNVLTPGQQATTRARPDESGQALPGQGAAIEIREVDTDPYTAWKSGDISFEGSDLGAIMRQIARWYDVEVEYEGGATPAIQFSGSVSRDRPLSQVLRALEASGQVRFEISGRRVVVRE